MKYFMIPASIEYLSKSRVKSSAFKAASSKNPLHCSMKDSLEYCPHHQNLLPSLHPRALGSPFLALLRDNVAYWKEAKGRSSSEFQSPLDSSMPRKKILTGILSSSSSVSTLSTSLHCDKHSKAYQKASQNPSAISQFATFSQLIWPPQKLCNLQAFHS